MTVTSFLSLLAGFSAITGLTTEAFKKILADTKKGFSSTLIAAIVGMVIGGAGTAVYYILTNQEFTTVNIVFMILMGFASTLTATTSYDKIKLCILGLGEKK